MDLPSAVKDGVARWSAARGTRTPLSVEELCAEMPEFAPLLREQIARLEGMDGTKAAGAEGMKSNKLSASRTPAGAPESSTVEHAVEPGSDATVHFTPETPDRFPAKCGRGKIGDYELLEEIARGGMGVVYKARQTGLGRIVAVKMISAGGAASDAEVERFRKEAAAAAQLDHPHIVPVFEVGCCEGQHFFSMGYVDGKSLSAKLVDGPLPPGEAAAIVRTVAEAVAYAHDQGLIHRDLKPGNILIDRDGQPRVTDFGLAKHLREVGQDLTQTGQVLGTPGYMPPEQAMGRPSLVREAADIYGLGAVLYALLTGRPPFQADTPFHTLRMVLEQEVVPPRRLNAAVPVDLETISLKCLEKNPARRYGTAGALREDLVRFLDGRPILARPVSKLEHAWKWCGRNRLVAGLLAAVAVSLVLGTVASTTFAILADRRALENAQLVDRESRAKRQAEAERAAALREAANLALQEAENLSGAGEANTALLWMAKGHELATQSGDAALADACRAMISGWLADVPRLESPLAEGESSIGRFGPDDATVVVGQNAPWSPRFRTFDARSLRQRSEHAGVRLPGNFLALSPDRSRAVLVENGVLRLWSLQDEKAIGAPMAIAGDLSSAAFDGAGTLLATATTRGDIQVWDGKTGASAGAFTEPQIGVKPQTCRVLFNRAGNALWIAGSGGRLDCRRVPDGAPLRKPYRLSPAAFSMEPLRNGDFLVVGTNSDLTRILDVRSDPPKEVQRIKSQLQYDFDVHPNGRYLLAGGRGMANEARFHALDDDAYPRSAPMTAPATVTAVQHSRSGATVLVSHLKGVGLWRTPDVVVRQVSPAMAAPGERSSILPDRRLTIAVSEDEPTVVTVASVESGAVLRRCEPWKRPLVKLAADPSGRLAVAVDQDRRVVVLNLVTGECRGLEGVAAALPERIVLAPGGRSALLLLPDATVGDRSGANPVPELWNLGRGVRVELPPEARQGLASSAAFDATGEILGLPCDGNAVRFLRAADGKLVASRAFEIPISAMAFHPDGQRCFVGDCKGLIQVFGLRSDAPPVPIGSHDASIHGLFLSPAQDLLVSSADDHVVRIWHADGRGPAAAPVRNTGRVHQSLVIDGEGRLAAIHSNVFGLRLIHLRTGRRVSPVIPLAVKWPPPEFAFDAKEHTLRAAFYHAALSRTVVRRLYRVPTEPASLRLFVETWTGLSLEGNDVRVLSPAEWKDRRDELARKGSSAIDG